MKKHHLDFILLAIALILVSCNTYYMDLNKAKQSDPIATATDLDSLNNTGRYFILHTGGRYWHMYSLALSPDGKSFTFKLEPVDIDHRLHADKGADGKYRYRPERALERKVINEVHIYVSGVGFDPRGNNGVVTLPLDQVERVEVLTKDKGRTTSSFVWGSVGVTVGLLVVVGVIVAATKSSCPFISAYDGTSFVLQGEVFGGAIYPQLARHDYLPLTMRPSPDGALSILIHNELKERQHTDVASLMVATHSKDFEVLTDSRGNLHTVGKSQPPLSAQLGIDRNCITMLEAEDNHILEMNDSSRKTGINEVLLRFANPGHSRSVKLILRLKNSEWLDMLYGEVAKGLGTAYEKYVERQKKVPAGELRKWVEEQNIPLTISIRGRDGWKLVEQLKPIGPLAFRKIAIPLDLEGGEEVEVKLSSGFMFWEIDYASLDTAKNQPIDIVKLSPESAIDQDGRSWLKEISHEDNVHLDQPEIGDAATIVYRLPNLNDSSRTRSYFLDAAGYYEPIRKFDSNPDLRFLKQFKKPDAMSAFGLKLYNRMSRQLTIAQVPNK